MCTSSSSASAMVDNAGSDDVCNATGMGSIVADEGLLTKDCTGYPENYDKKPANMKA